MAAFCAVSAAGTACGVSTFSGGAATASTGTVACCAGAVRRGADTGQGSFTLVSMAQSPPGLMQRPGQIGGGPEGPPIPTSYGVTGTPAAETAGSGWTARQTARRTPRSTARQHQRVEVP